MLSQYTFGLLATLFVGMLGSVANAQLVRGYVVDAVSKDSLTGVHVIRVGRGVGTVTDSRGYFRMSAPTGDSLHFSATGYRAQTVAAGHPLTRIYLLPDTVMLSEVQVVAERILTFHNKINRPLRLPGVPYVEHPTRVKPGSWTWGRKNFSKDAPPWSPLAFNASLAGPISYFIGYEKDQRKYERELATASAQRGYRQAIDDETTRTLLTEQFRLTDHQYDSLLILFNQRELKLVQNAKREEVFATLLWFFNDALHRQ